MNQLTNTAKKLDTLFKILRIVATIGIVCALVALAIIGTGFLFDLDPYTIGSGYNILSLGFIDLEVAEAYAPDEQMVLMVVAAAMVIALSYLLVIRSCFDCIRDILKPMREGAPFHTSVSTNLKKLAKKGILLFLLSNFAKLLTTIVFVFGFDLPGLLIGEKITHISIHMNLDLTFLVISAILLLLSYIFHYGEELQQLSDETI